jgi:hypothetical protein
LLGGFADAGKDLLHATGDIIKPFGQIVKPFAVAGGDILGGAYEGGKDILGGVASGIFGYKEKREPQIVGGLL